MKPYTAGQKKKKSAKKTNFKARDAVVKAFSKVK